MSLYCAADGRLCEALKSSEALFRSSAGLAKFLVASEQIGRPTFDTANPTAGLLLCPCLNNDLRACCLPLILSTKFRICFV